MKRSVQLFVFSLMAVLLVSSTAFAADVKQAETSDAPVILYEHGVGVGKTIEPVVPSSAASVALDESISNVFIGRDDIVVVLYEHKDFGGKKVVLDKKGMNTMPDFGFNDKTSSYEVYFKPGAKKVTLYEHTLAGGWNFEADVPSTADVSMDHNDLISSVLVPDANTVVVLFEHITSGGRSLTLDKPGLFDLEALKFNDIVSSYEIRTK